MAYIVHMATKFSNIAEDANITKALDFLDEEIGETALAYSLDDWPEVLDGFGDVAYVAINGIYKTFKHLGVDHEEAVVRTHAVLMRICEANLAKISEDGTVTKVDGKVQKPDGWTAPTYDDLL